MGLFNQLYFGFIHSFRKRICGVTQVPFYRLYVLPVTQPTVSKHKWAGLDLSSSTLNSR